MARAAPTPASKKAQTQLGHGWVTSQASGANSDNLNLGVLLLEELAHAGHGAAGANAGDEDVDLAVGVIPDLGAGRGLVDGG